MKLDEVIIDAVTRFKQQHTTTDKVLAAVKSFPDEQEKQKKLEAEVAAKLVEADALINKRLSSYRLELRRLSKNFRDGLNLLDVLIFSLGDLDIGSDIDMKSGKIYATEFMLKHYDLILKTAEEYMAELDKLKAWSEKQGWPIKNGLTRWTKFSSFYQDGTRRITAIKSFKTVHKKAR
jgi:hypothetical protein